MLSYGAVVVALALGLLPGPLAAGPAPTPAHGLISPRGAELAASGQWRQGFAVADLDGNGSLDVVHGPPRAGDGTPRLFLNDGRGDLQPWREARFPDLPFDYGDATAADFDGDGRIDIAFGVHLRGVGVLLGDGLGGFRPALGAPAWTEEAPFGTVAVDAVDWDGDGRVDLVALAEGPRPGREQTYGLRVFRNLEGGWTRIDGEDPGRLFGDGLVIGDFDGDGRPDAAAASRSLAHHGQIFLGRGAAGWALAEAPLRRSAYVFAVAACDVDGDQRDELAVGFLERRGDRWRNGVDLLDLAPGGAWTRSVLSERAGEESPRALACGDVDGDGHADVVVGSSVGHLTLLRGKGRGRFSRPRKLGTGAAGGGCSARHLELADLDMDRGAELVGSFASAPGGECRTGGALLVWRLQ